MQTRNSRLAGKLKIKEMEKEYNKLLKSGMFWEFFPKLSGNWLEDKSEFIKSYKGIIVLNPKNATAREFFMPICKHTNFLRKTFTNITNEREYYLFTEVFCYLHGGNDFCNCNANLNK